MSSSRRDFIKFVVVGSVVAGCPIDETLIATPDLTSKTAPLVHGEQFEICHRLRDGHTFESPVAKGKADIVIVGGGAAGLSAAYFLRSKDWLLLEKEDHFGGNAFQEEYEGQPYGTGSAYAYKDDHGDQLAREIGLHLPLVNCPDPTIVNNTFVADTWKTGLDQLPYPKEIRASFKKFRDDVMKINVREKMAELDAQPFSDFTANYAPEVRQWWDVFGPSNWGATTELSSALVGLSNVQDLITGGDGKRVILPGGLGCITHKLVEVLQLKYKDRMLNSAPVVAVAPEEDTLRVTYFQEGKIAAVVAKLVLMCAPMLIASRIVMGLPSEQKAAMRRYRYAPYPVVNLIFDKPVYNRGYDTWCPGNSFTDFIVADWTVRNTPGYKQKHNILSVYTPLRPNSALLCLPRKTANRLPPAFSLISRSCGRSSM